MLNEGKKRNAPNLTLGNPRKQARPLMNPNTPIRQPKANLNQDLEWKNFISQIPPET